MNSLYVIEGDGGGAVSHVLALAKRLMGGGVHPTIVFLCGGPSVDVSRQLGLQVYLVQKRLPLDIHIISKLCHIIRKNNIDLVHSHTIRGNFYARLSALLCRKQVISLTTVHSHIVDELRGKETFGFKDWMLWLRERCLWPSVDHFICVSEGLRQRLLYNGVKNDKISVIENGVQVPDLGTCSDDRLSVRKEFGINDKECIVTTIGRLVPVKNHYFFLKTAREISRRVKHVRFLIIGDGDLLDFLRTTAREWALESRVIFAGWRNDIPRLLCATDIYAICSFIEGLNLSVLEAMAHGVPVVGTNVPGIANVVRDEETGKLVAVDDVFAMSEAIMKLAEDQGLAQKMGLSGREEIQHRYSVGAMVNSTQALYSELVESQKRRRI